MGQRLDPIRASRRSVLAAIAGLLRRLPPARLGQPAAILISRTPRSDPNSRSRNYIRLRLYNGTFEVPTHPTQSCLPAPRGWAWGPPQRCWQFAQQSFYATGTGICVHGGNERDHQALQRRAAFRSNLQLILIWRRFASRFQARTSRHSFFRSGMRLPLRRCRKSSLISNSA